jgi:hypothetical protein
VSDVEGATRRVRQLLLSGDNTLKNRHDPASRERARARYEEALTVAQDAGLGDEVTGFVRRRLEQDGVLVATRRRAESPGPCAVCGRALLPGEPFHRFEEPRRGRRLNLVCPLCARPAAARGWVLARPEQQSAPAA